MQTPDREFKPYPKVPRFLREIVITEKIDGTNAGILIEPRSADGAEYERPGSPTLVRVGDDVFAVYAASRKRWITPEKDNYGFAGWVEKNALTLAADLGPGMHFGEWWGAGIQRRYGQPEKRLSLFNVHKWHKPRKVKGLEAEVPHFLTFATPNLGVVPVLFEGEMWELLHFGLGTLVCDELRRGGSIAAPGFMDPEGIMIFHARSGQLFKYTLDGDGHKG